MRVNIFDVTEPGTKVFRATCDIAECFPDDQDAAKDAASEIHRSGQSWHGGGAAPAVILESADD